jgi:hypothetical protein
MILSMAVLNWWTGAPDTGVPGALVLGDGEQGEAGDLASLLMVGLWLRLGDGEPSSLSEHSWGLKGASSIGGVL